MRNEQLSRCGAAMLRPLARCVVATAVAALALGGRAEAQSTYTWNKASGTNSWNNSANWSPTTGFPNAVGDVANLNNISPTGAVTINLNQTITVGQLLIGDNSSGGGYLPYTIAAGTAGSLVFDATSGNAILSKPTAGNNSNGDTISANVTLNDNLNITNAAIGNLNISGNITDDSNSRSINKLGVGRLVLSGTNSYGGGTTVSEGTLQFNSAAAIAGSGRDVTVSPGATVAAGYALDNAFLNRVAESNDAFTVALGVNSSSNLDFGSSAGATLGNARLGATGAFTYSGVLTPNGTTYRLGGGGGTLTVSSALNDSSGGATSVLVDYSGGTVILSGANGYTGGSTVTAGTLRFNSAGAIGGSGRDVTVNAGAVVALGFSSVQATLTNRIVNTSAGAVALTANSSEALDFSSAGANLTAASLGAVGTVAYSGTLTPNGTTYRLGGGGGTLTVSSALTDSPGSEARSLVVDASSGGTVILSNSGNTFTGATTVANGTLQLTSAGAFNNIARTVSINSGGVLAFNATDAAKAAAVTVNSGGLATFSAASAANGGTFTINSGGTANVTAANAANGGTFTVNSGGVLGTAPDSIESAYTGSTIYLDGGTLRYATQGDSTARVRTVGGTVVVRANSTYNAYSIGNGSPPVPLATAIFGALDFNADGYTLTVSNAGTATSKPATITSQFVGSTFSHSGTLNVNAARALVELNNTAIRAGKTLTKTGGQAFTVSGSLGVALLGGAELLGADSFTMITAANTFTNTSTFDTTNGLWSVSSGTSPVSATLAAPVGSIANGQSVAFTASDAATVSLTGLTNGNAYPLTISLENAANQATVMSQLAKNPAFSNIAASGTSQIAMVFTAPAATTRFAWDNVHTSSSDWYLGGNLTAVAAAFSVADPAAVLTLSAPLSGGSDWYFSGAGSTVVSGAISGADVIKAGTGALTLSAGNGQANTTVNDGRLNVNHFAALGTPAGTLTMASGTSLDNTSGAPVSVSNPKSIALGNSLTFVGSNDLDLGGGTTTLSAETTFDIQAGELTLDGDVVGAGFGIIKNGAGTLALGGLSGTSSFTGSSTINAGTLLLEGSSILGGGSSTIVTLGANGFLEVGASASLGNVTVAGVTQNLITNTPVNANQNFTVSQTLTTANAKYNGVQTLFTGATVTATHNYLGTIPASATAGRIVFQNGSTLAATEDFEIAPNQGVSFDAGTAIVSVAAGKRVFIESAVTGSGGLRKTGAGNLRLTGTNTYQGGTLIEQGILGISSGAALGDVAGSVTIDGATLAAATNPNGSGSGATIDAARTVFIGNGKTSGLHAQTGLTLRYDGVISEIDSQGSAGSVQFGFDAVREGTVILGGANTYRGDTILSHGTLKLASGGSFANSARIIVGDATSNGAIFDLTDKTSFAIGASQTLMGKGRVLLGPSTVLTIDGLLSPGNSPSLFTYDGGGTVTLAGTTLMEVWGTSRGVDPGYDAIDVVNGTDLTFGGILNLNFDQTFGDGTVFNLFTPDGTSSLTGNFSSIAMVGSAYSDLTFTNNAGIWTTNTGAANQSMSFNSATGTLSIIVVPEPAGIALLASAAAGCVAWSRRRTRHGNAKP